MVKILELEFMRLEDLTYELLDSGSGYKLEKFGNYVLQRPASQAVWQPSLKEDVWQRADGCFTREPVNRWTKQNFPREWVIEVSGVKFKIASTDFGHLGIFPEQEEFWSWLQPVLQKRKQMTGEAPQVLNLFAYSGGVTLAAAKAGAKVCHLDASKGMVSWARENAALNNLQEAPIRWIVDDVLKFLKREIRRGQQYDAIILDPPTFGRGSQGEVFKIEEAIIELLQDCSSLLSNNPLFLMLSCHTPGFSPTVLENLLGQILPKGNVVSGEMVLRGKQALPLPSGCFARWSAGVEQ